MPSSFQQHTTVPRRTAPRPALTGEPVLGVVQAGLQVGCVLAVPRGGRRQQRPKHLLRGGPGEGAVSRSTVRDAGGGGGQPNRKKIARICTTHMDATVSGLPK